MCGHGHSECRGTGTGGATIRRIQQTRNDSHLFLSQGLDNSLKWEKLPASITRDQGLPSQCGLAVGWES